MIRFKPDSWADALMRPFAMAAPDANVYVEIAAPDLRFFILVLLGLTAAAMWLRLNDGSKPVLALLLFVLLSMGTWMATSGNGRYYIPILLLVGPLCIGMVCVLPITRPFQLFLALSIFSAQVYVLALNPPWDSWGLLQWKDAPYFQVDLPKYNGEEATTYVTISSISYSLIAPLFPANSSWISLYVANPSDTTKIQKRLKNSKRIVLVVPSVRQYVGVNRLPNGALNRVIADMLAPKQLVIDSTKVCELLPSRGLGAMENRRTGNIVGEELTESGFWLCPLTYKSGLLMSEDKQNLVRKTNDVFSRIEELCPRFFPPGTSATQLITNGATRHYGEADTWIYVLDDGSVMYKFWRTLNPVLIGTTENVLSGEIMLDCKKIRGKTGFPWNRGI